MARYSCTVTSLHVLYPWQDKKSVFCRFSQTTKDDKIDRKSGRARRALWQP